MSVTLVAAGLSDRGRVRAANEDALAVSPEERLLIVADGMGGHKGGATAARIVVTALPQLLQQRLASPRLTRAALCSGLQDAMLELSASMRDYAADDPALHGMGATVVLALMRGASAVVAHMGDSRAYLFRAGKLRQITADHSIVNILLRSGEITPEQAKKHPARHQISRYMGMASDVYPDVATLGVKVGDRLLLCSDGLTNMVDDIAIASSLARNVPAEDICRSLVDAANAAGGVDNVTVVVADIAAATHAREPRSTRASRRATTGTPRGRAGADR